MTPRATITAAAAAALALAACRGRASPAPADAGVAQVAKALSAIVATCASTGGDVQVRRGGAGPWQPAGTGAVLRPGDVVRTGAASFARVAFVQGGALELEENAAVTIGVAPPPDATTGEHAKPPEGSVSVEAGVVRGFLPDPGNASQPLGMVIQGADGSRTRLAAKPGEKAVAFRVTRATKAVEVAVVHGQVAVQGPAGAETTLRSGQAVDVAAGEVGEVSDLLEFPASLEPGIDARFRFAPGLAIRIAWKKVPGAAGYRVQFARDLSFERIERTEEVEQTETVLEPPAEGTYAWRVASRDAAGHIGEYGFARRISCEKEQPRDLLVGPNDGAVVAYTERRPIVEFTWQTAGAARRYRLVVAKTPDLLRHKVVSRSTSAQRLDLEGLAAGSYYWGVYVDDRAPLEPIFVRPRALVVQRSAKAAAGPRSASRRAQ